MSTTHRPIGAHVIVTHDLNIRVQNVLGMFSVAGHCDPELLRDVARSMLEDIIRDATTLEGELRAIKRWARSQLDKLPTKL